MIIKRHDKGVELLVWFKFDISRDFICMKSAHASLKPLLSCIHSNFILNDDVDFVNIYQKYYDIL